MNSATLHRIVAIHGAPRSGTSWLGQLFNSNEHVAYRYQPLFSYAFKGRLTDQSGTVDIARFLDDLLVSQDDFVLQRDGASLAGYELSFGKREITHLVYKEVRYHDVLENLLKREPRTLAIGIVRDPCAAIHSWLHAPREFDLTWDPLIEWHDAPRKNAGKPENWYGFNRWKELASLFHRLRERFPNRFLIVRYEALVRAPEKTLSRLFDACGLSMTPQVAQFVGASRARDDGMPYGVFRDAAQGRPTWRDELDTQIIEAIHDDLRGTPLEHYLDVHPVPAR